MSVSAGFLKLKNSGRPTQAWGRALHLVSQVTAFTSASESIYISYRGPAHLLAIVATLPEARLNLSDGSIDFPMTRASLLALESFVPIERATLTYATLRLSLSSSSSSFVYPAPLPGQNSPFPHQIAALQDFYDHLMLAPQSQQGYGYYLEQGMGKTRLSGDTIRLLSSRYANTSPIRTVLIIAQKIAARQWESTLVDCGVPSSQVIVLTGTLEERKRSLIKYSALAQKLSFTSSSTPAPYVFILNWEAYARVVPSIFPLDIMILDEAHRMKDRRTQWSKALHRASSQTRFRINLTGTPVGESGADVWSQYRWLNPLVFGSSYHRFVEEYCILGGWEMRQIVGMQPQNLAQFVSKMYSCAHRATKAATMTMPTKQYLRFVIKPKPNQARAYAALSKEMFYKHDNEDGTSSSLSVDNALVKSLRLMQITAGFIPSTTQETSCLNGNNDTTNSHSDEDLHLSSPADASNISVSHRASHNNEHDERLDKTIPAPHASSISSLSQDLGRREVNGDSGSHGNTAKSTSVASVIELGSAKTEFLGEWISEKLEEDPTTKFIVWTRFRQENQGVFNHLSSKINASSLAPLIATSRVAQTNGSTKDHQREAIRLLFNDRSSSLAVWVIQIQTGAQSLDVPVADYVIYHTQTPSGIERSQSEDRGHRGGRTRPYFVVDVLISNTVDIGANRASRQKKDLASLIVTEGFGRSLETDSSDTAPRIGVSL